MTRKNNKFSIIERALANEIGYFMSMSDAELEKHIPNSRIKERVAGPTELIANNAPASYRLVNMRCECL
jgi:hypothetical protein